MINLLVAYPYFKKEKILKIDLDKTRLLIDSGAFTAWKSGNEIRVEEYCDFIESLPVKPWRYFALDVIGDFVGTQKNLDYMLHRGLKPIPVFTRGEDFSHLNELYKVSDVVAIGGLVKTPRNKGYVKRIMREVNGRKVHWLGFTNLGFLKAFKPFSCDSSSWDTAGRYGVLKLYVGNGKLKSLTFDDFIKDKSLEVRIALRKYGVDPNVMTKKESWLGGSDSVSRYLSAKSALDMSRDIEKHLGIKFFLASSAYESIYMLYRNKPPR